MCSGAESEGRMLKSKFGPGGNSRSFYDEGKKSTVDAPEWLFKKGLDAYEYEGGKGLFASGDTLDKIRKNAGEYNIKMSLHAPYYISLSSTDPDIREKSVEYIMKSAAFADMLGADIFVVHSGSSAKLDRGEAMRLAEDTLSKAALAMEAGGVKSRLGIETMGKQNQLGTVEEVVRLCRISPEHFWPVVDFGHINARYGGTLKAEEDFKKIFDNISVLGADRAEGLHCHFSKVEFTEKGEKRHLTFKDTEYGPEFAPLARAITALGVGPTIICESAGTMAEDALEMKSILNNIASGEAK